LRYGNSGNPDDWENAEIDKWTASTVVPPTNYFDKKIVLKAKPAFAPETGDYGGRRWSCRESNPGPEKIKAYVLHA